MPLGLVLADAARDLEGMDARISRIDEAVGGMLAETRVARPTAALLQEVDLLRQSVDCIRILILNLAQQDLGDCRVCPGHAARGVYLEAVRRGCLGGSG